MSLQDDCGLNVSDMAHQRKEWLLCRIGWAAIAVLFGAGMLGVFGAGPLSQSSLSVPGSGMMVQYARFERHRAPSNITLTLAGGRPEGEAVRLALGADFLSHNQISRIEPEPVRVEAWADHNTYVFELPSANDSITIRLHFDPDRVGNVLTTLQLEGLAPVTFEQFVYP